MNAPKFRFKGYTNNWKQRKLREIANKVTTKNIGIQYIETLTNSAEYGIISQRDYFDHDVSNLENIDGYYIVEDNDFVYNPRISTTAPVGPVNRNKLGRTGVISPLYTVFKTHDVDKDYLEWFFKSSHWHQFMYFNGDTGARSDRFSIKDAVFFDMPIPTPDVEEQRNIGRFITELDKFDTLFQRKCDALKDLKKGMLQKMFPKEGAKIPEFRFKGFTGDWKKRKLGDVLQFQNGFNGEREAYGKGTAFISVMDILNNQFITDDCIRGKATVTDDELERFSVRYGDVLFQRSSENVEDAGTSNVYVDTDNTAIFGGFVIRGRQIAPYSPRFMKYLLDTKDVRNQITKKAQGAQHVNVSQETLQDVQISLPGQKEQEAVEGCLCNLDNLIALHQRKCDKLKKIKKGLLQKMFI